MDPKVATWLELAKDDLAFAGDVLKNRKSPHYVAHLCHQAIEKLLKAVIQQKTKQLPPRTHNFFSLCQAANLNLPEIKMNWLMEMAPHYIGTRYPEDLAKLRERYTLPYAKKVFFETKDMFQWLKKKYLKSEK